MPMTYDRQRSKTTRSNMLKRKWKIFAFLVVALCCIALYPVLSLGVFSSLSIENKEQAPIVKEDHENTEYDNKNISSSLPAETLKRWLNGTISPPNTPVAFIHIGKTGGSTVSSQLANGCHSWVKKPCQLVTNETLISRLSTYMHVPDFYNGMISKHRYRVYVISVRDPFSKFLSSFTYEHPDNVKVAGGPYALKRIRQNQPFFEPCFPSVESFAEALGDGDPLEYDYPFPVTTVNNTNCTSLARAAMNNRVRGGLEHMYANTKFVISLLPENSLSNSTILLLRQENLWGDWQAANQWLGQPEDDVAPFPNVRIRDYSTVKLPVSKKVSALGQQRLCRALEPEYLVYLDLVRRASNLAASDKEQALKLAQEHCPLLNLTLSA